MARTSRVRQKETTISPTGKYYIIDSNTGTVLSSTSVAPQRQEWKYIADSIGRPVQDSDLTLYRHSREEHFVLNGYKWRDPSSYYLVQDVPITSPGDWEWMNPPGMPPFNTSVTQLYARTNLSRPEWNYGSFVQNLVSLPKLIQEAANHLRLRTRAPAHRQMANVYLSTLFGWVPLFRDIQLLTDAGSIISQRNDELKRLASNQGLKRRVRLGEWTGSKTLNYTLSTGAPYGTIYGTTDSVSTVSRWGVIKMIPDSPGFSELTDTERWNLARRLAYGATASGAFAGAWDLLPWTWISDWFLNTKDYVLAHGNTVPVTYSKACVMEQWKVKNSSRITYVEPTFTVGGNSLSTLSTKYRRVNVTPSLSLTFPYLGGGRLAILGALFAQRSS